MANIKAKAASSILEEIASRISLGYEQTTDDVKFEIVLTMHDTGVNVREFAAFLSVLDRVYGRVSILGLRSYALRERAQLEILGVNKGSVVIHFGDSLSNFIPNDPTGLIILYLFLAYGPAGIKTLTEAAKNVADSYKSFQEGRLASANRKKTLDEMKTDPVLTTLSDKQQAELRRMIRYLAESESRRIPAMKRFVVKFVKGVMIRVRSKNSNDRNQR